MHFLVWFVFIGLITHDKHYNSTFHYSHWAVRQNFITIHLKLAIARSSFCFRFILISNQWMIINGVFKLKDQGHLSALPRQTPLNARLDNHYSVFSNSFLLINFISHDQNPAFIKISLLSTFSVAVHYYHSIIACAANLNVLSKSTVPIVGSYVFSFPLHLFK